MGDLAEAKRIIAALVEQFYNLVDSQGVDEEVILEAERFLEQ